ncbi:Glycosyl transferases group 1 [Hyphomicrobium facile]|uniref:Glycosyl transferases group 1 n=2 Tax=Hyphomicrobium facile TaxID=51670 RepID=A0A1I7NDF4_9HYPH|nr:Glycosyl transferases group 1 [Hyphomicrobium facile]
MAHAQHAARALAEHGLLEAFVTTLSFQLDGALSSLLSRMPTERATRIAQQLGRRAIDQVPAHLLRCYPMWEILRSAVMMSGAGPVLEDMVWDRMSHSFDALVAHRYVPQTKSIHAFEYTALASFQRAKKEGVSRVLHLPSLDSKQFDEVQQREKSEWPELVGKHDSYFNGKFERRYERRRQEIALAEVMIANSSLTARSHIRAGADASRMFVVPLAAPAPIAEVRADPKYRARPLEVIWAGQFSLGKGAHYLLRAWQLLNAGPAARLNVYGRFGLPARLRAMEREDIFFHGSVTQPELFKAYEAGDVLVFPTLSDGFGMVVAEAMARGLPVIISDQAGAADLVTADNGLIIPAADPQALADSLRWCLDNRDRLFQMRFHALETARRKQWSDFRRELITILEKGLYRAGYHPAPVSPA